MLVTAAVTIRSSHHLPGDYHHRLTISSCISCSPWPIDRHPGSGKSTLLRCINHLEKIGSGRIYVNGHLVGYRQEGDRLHELRPREVAAQRRDIGMVFQHFNLFPHMTAPGNVTEAPILVRKEPKDLATERARKLLHRVGLADKTDCYPLSSPAGNASASPSPARSPCNPS